MMRVANSVFLIWLVTQDRSQAVEEMVWPKNKANFSDSFLPPTLQLVSYLMEKLEIRDTSLSEISTAGPASTTSGAVQEVSSALRAQEGSSTASSPPVADEIRKSQGRARVQARADHAWQELQPMVAYIVLGRLRDALTIEARKRGLNRLQGFTTSVTQELARTSKGSSSDQLQELLTLMLTKNHVKRRESIYQANQILEELQSPTSVLRQALETVPPLAYTL